MFPRVLIIETDSDLRTSIATHLRQLGFAVSEAAKRSEALAALGRDAPQVVLLGLGGPGRQGLSLLGQIRSEWPAVQVITLNEREQIDLSIEAMKMGAFADLMPPFDRDALRDSVREASCGRLP